MATQACTDRPESPFRMLTDTGIVFENKLAESDSFNIIQYLYYYNGGGVAAGDLNGDDLPDLYFTANEGSDQLYLNNGDWTFTNVSEKAGLKGRQYWSNGVTMVDINADGLLDIYVCQLGAYKGQQGRNRLYLNQGDMRFREAAAEYGLDFRGLATHSAFFDYDRDGDLDVYLLNHSVHAVGNYGRAATLRPEPDSLAGDRLLRNDNGRFVDVTTQAGIFSSRIGYGLGIGISDLNLDGWPDIYVSNDFHENDYFYLNQGDGTFRESIATTLSQSSQFSMGNGIADINNDQLPDIITLDMQPEQEKLAKSSVGADLYQIYQLKRRFGYHHQFPRNMLQLNRGIIDEAMPVFSEIAWLAGIAATDWSWAPLIVDMDGDGWKDLFITNGIRRRPNDLDYLKYVSNQQIQQSATDQELAGYMPDGAVPNYAFRNRGDLTFEAVTESWGFDRPGISNGAIFTDIDRDGDPDLVINNLNALAGLYRNDLPSDHHYLRIRLQGEGANTYGIGARVSIITGDRTISQELYTSQGYLSSAEPVLLFGLGDADTVDAIEVIWPDDRISRRENVRTDTELIIDQSEARHADKPAPAPSLPLLSSLARNPGLEFIHQENDFNDLEREPLMPRLLSTEGPRLAVGDVNADGHDDVFVCGGAGQSSTLFYQTAGGSFTEAPPYFSAHLMSEATAAAFFDADEDGDLDLYIVHGGGAEPARSPTLSDALYRNNGSGDFQYDPEALPTAYGQGSCVVPLDFNQDGAMDLFVGSRSVPLAYGMSPQSRLLQNDGRGYFQDVSAIHLPQDGRLGMVTDAHLTQYGGQPALAVVGEWMPLQWLQFGPGVWTVDSLPNSHGWWNRIETGDLNGDGVDDLILGNWGLNSTLRASEQEPLSLYVYDFDNNGRTDPILTYYRQGREYTFVSTDELLSQLPGIKKQLQDYAGFAERTVRDIFTAGQLSAATVRRSGWMASSVALSNVEGSYTLSALPTPAQFSPVYGIVVRDLNGDGHLDILLGGNFYGSRPAIGRMDAQTGCLLLGDGKGHFTASRMTHIDWHLSGAIRDLQLLTTPEGMLLLAARNDQPLGVWKVNIRTDLQPQTQLD